MFLASLALRDWKSFGAQEARSTIKLAQLTLLVGPNASGKSNALDALRFLQGAALDFPLGDVLRGRFEGQREVWPAIRGGVVEAARANTNAFTIGTRWVLEENVVDHSMTVTTTGDVALDAERLAIGDRYLFDTAAASLGVGAGRTAGGSIRAALHSKKGGRNAGVEYAAARSLLGQVEVVERVQPMVVDVANEVRRAFREAVFLDIRPSLMRDYRPENGGHLGTAGENISPVLAALSESQLQTVIDWLSELCAPDIHGIEFDRTRLREVMMILVEGDGRRTSARSASDGTLRFLGELVAIMTAPMGSLLVLEEPDVGLHPSRIRLLAELLESLTRERHVQVLATTHSPTLLAHLSETSLGNVVAFGRDADTGASVCARVADLPHFDTLVASRNVEHLVSTGWLERAL